MDDRIEHIRDLQEKGFKHQPRQSSVLGNFYAIITIAVVCLSVLYYVNYVQPAQEKQALKEFQITKHQEFLNERARRIALSHKLNARDYNETK